MFACFSPFNSEAKNGGRGREGEGEKGGDLKQPCTHTPIHY